MTKKEALELIKTIQWNKVSEETKLQILSALEQDDIVPEWFSSDPDDWVTSWEESSC